MRATKTESMQYYVVEKIHHKLTVNVKDLNHYQ